MTYLAAMADFSRVATGGLMAAVWQGVLLAAVVGLGLRLLPKTPAAVRFAIWFAVFLLVAALPAASLWPHAAGATQAGGREPWLTLDSRWSVAIAAVWAVASLVRAITLVVAAVQVRTLSRRARPVEWEGASGIHPTHRDSAAMDRAPGVLGGLRRVLPVTRRAQICTSDEVDRPTVIGFLSPKILIPTWLLEKLTAVELDQIVLHETGHLGRADDWMNLLQKVALVVFPLNPALAWVERRLCFERESACDERVLSVTQAPKAYAACLATLAEHRLGRRGLALALGALGRESDLGRRVGRILRRGDTMGPVQAKLVLGGAMLGLLGGAVGLERCPQVVGFTTSSGQSVAVAAPRSVRVGAGYEAGVFRAGLRFNDELAQRVNPSRYAGQTVASVVRADETRPHGLKPQTEGGVYGTFSKADVAERRYAAERTDLAECRGLAACKDVAERKTVGAARVDLVELRSLNRAESKAADRIEASEWNFAGTRSTVGLQDRWAGQTGDAAVEWLVMTSWQGADGSQMVLTMASNPNARGTAVPHQVVSDTEPSAYQVYPYAAVPVRGGWLVFQL